MVCWSLKSAEYKVDIDHRAGEEKVVSDDLSRNPQEYLEVVKKVKVSFVVFGIEIEEATDSKAKGRSWI